LIGIYIYLAFLKNIWSSLQQATKQAVGIFEQLAAMDTGVIFVGILVSMLVGETLWAQYSTFALTGQIMAMIGLASCSLNWAKPMTRLKGRISDLDNFK